MKMTESLTATTKINGELKQKIEKFHSLLEEQGLKYTFERKYICEEVLKLK